MLNKTVFCLFLAFVMAFQPVRAEKKKQLEPIKWCKDLQQVLNEAKERECPIMFVTCDNSTYAIIKKEMIDNPDMIKDSKKFAMMFMNIDEDHALLTQFNARYRYDFKGLPAISFASKGGDIKREYDCTGSGNALYAGPGAGPYLKDYIQKALDLFKEGLDADTYYAINGLISEGEEKWEDMNYKEAIEAFRKTVKVKAYEKFLKRAKEKLDKLEKDAAAELETASKKEAEKNFGSAAEVYIRVGNYEGFQCAAEARKKLEALKKNNDAKEALAKADRDFRARKALKKAQRLEKNGDTKNALYEYQGIIKTFPETPYVKDAEAKVAELKPKQK